MTGATQRQLIAAGVCYVPQGRNIFPELSVRHNIELGAGSRAPERSAIPRTASRPPSIAFPRLRAKADRQASTLSGGEQKQLEIVRGLLLDPKLVMIDEPRSAFRRSWCGRPSTFWGLRERGVSVLMIEQNARSALEISDYELVLELGRTRIFDKAQNVLNDPRVAQLFLGGRRKATRHESAAARIGGREDMNNASIATVSLSGALDEKLRAIAEAGFAGVEIFEADFLSFNGSPRDVGALCDDLGLTITAFQPFRDFEGMPEPQRARDFRARTA